MPIRHRPLWLSNSQDSSRRRPLAMIAPLWGGGLGLAHAMIENGSVGSAAGSSRAITVTSAVPRDSASTVSSVPVTNADATAGREEVVSYVRASPSGSLRHEGFFAGSTHRRSVGSLTMAT